MVINRLTCISIFLLLASISSCNYNKEKKGKLQLIDLKGSWAGCDYDGYYLEIHFNENSAMTCHEDVLDFAFIAPYTIWKDSIYYYNPIVDKVLPDKFELIENRLITHHDEIHISKFEKISETPLYPLGCNANYNQPLDPITKKHYDYMFLKRKLDFDCIKNDTTEVILLDSIDDDFEDIIPR